MKAKISVLPASILLFSLMYLPMKEANSNSKFTSFIGSTFKEKQN